MNTTPLFSTSAPSSSISPPGGGAHLHRVRPRRHLPGPGLSSSRPSRPFWGTIAPGGRVFAWGTPPWCGRSAGRTAPRSSFYGLNGDLAWQATAISPAPGGMRFTVLKEGARWGDFFLPMVGEHNVLNALAALAVLSRGGGRTGRLKRSPCPGLRASRNVRKWPGSSMGCWWWRTSPTIPPRWR